MFLIKKYIVQYANFLTAFDSEGVAFTFVFNRVFYYQGSFMEGTSPGILIRPAIPVSDLVVTGEH